MSYDYTSAVAAYNDLKTERLEWETEWRQISNYLLPGRGIYQDLTRPTKRKLTSPKVINSIAEDALYVLTSGMHGGLTSPSRPWFSLEWGDARIKDFEPLKGWLQECQSLLQTALQISNFYSIINSFYVEYAGFGTGCIYMGEDTDDSFVPFRFELLTAGEYTFAVNPTNRPNMFFRPIFMSLRNYVERFPKKARSDAKRRVKEEEAGIDRTYVTLLECIKQEDYDKERPYTRYIYEVQAYSHGGNAVPLGGSSDQEPLEVTGFYEFPYPLARWNTIGSDVYGIGPGSRALPDVKRLQEMERAFLKATHKTVDPPLNAPARMKGKLNTLPGGYNYYANPQETIQEIYNVRFDFQGVSAAVERVEQRIQRNFFNDIFLTAARDPNASPLRTGQVQVQEQEKMLRLGPVIERLQHEFLQPVIERGFNIMLRKGLFPPLPPDLAMMAGDYQISLISPLATAQRLVAVGGINSFMAFVGNTAQFDQRVLDNVNIDAAAREVADVTGVNLGILRPQEEVDQIRRARAQEQMRQQRMQEQMAQAQLAGELNAGQAAARKDEATAGQTLIEAQAKAAEAGLQ